MTTESIIAVIGIGSPFGSDRIGWQVIEYFKEQKTFNSDNVRLQSCDRPGTLLLDYIKDTKKVVLIDAVEDGIQGNIVVTDKNQLLQQTSLQSSHQLGVAETIALGDKLGLLPEDLLLLGIETGKTGEKFSPTPELFKKLETQILEELKNPELVSLAL